MAATATPTRYTGTSPQIIPASTASFRLRMLAPRIAGMDSRKEKRTANFRSSPTKQPAVIVVPEREMPGQVAMACPTPTSSTSSKVALFSVLRPFFTRSLAYSSTPVTIRAPATKYILSARPSTRSFTGSTTNSGNVPTMISRINRRAGGTGVGVEWWAKSLTPRKNSRTMSRMSSQ